MGTVTRVYDPRLKLDAINGRIPEQFKEHVTPDRLCKWKREKWNKLIGYSYYNRKETGERLLQRELSSVLKELKVAHSKNEIFELTLKVAAQSPDFQRILFKGKSKIIEAVEKHKKLYSVKQYSKLLAFNKNTYYEWKQLAKKECSQSKDFICVKRHPNRISFTEEQKMIELLKDERYAHYPLTSLMWIAKYDALVYAGRTAWERVKKQNHIQRLKPKRHKKTYTESLRADYANQYLHADITYFKLLSGKTYYIYIVKDNYSRLIKSWEISDVISPRVRLETFKRAIDDIRMEHDQVVTFVVDGGNENRANLVKSFVDANKNLAIQIARKDTPFSNSMIERFNFDLKYLYLYREHIRTLAQLKKSVEIAVKDHNYTKRIEILNGQTPYEVYHGIPAKSEWILEQWKQSKKQRVERARSMICCASEENFKKLN